MAELQGAGHMQVMLGGLGDGRADSLQDVAAGAVRSVDSYCHGADHAAACEPTPQCHLCQGPELATFNYCKTRVCIGPLASRKKGCMQANTSCNHPAS